LYYPKLDSIRCFAVLAVIFAHIFQIWTWERDTFDLFPLGNAGVVAFFVLSGFLITNLLLDEPPGQPLARSFRNFYMRRTLRIFPIYYLYLLVVFCFDLGAFKVEWSNPAAAPGGPLLTIRDTGVFPWLYLTNIWIYNHASWITFNSPLWTLSVEEQFYLVWPFIVLLLRGNGRALAAVFAFVCALGIGARLYLFLALGYTNTTPHIEVFTFTNLDFLACGGLLALAHRRYGESLGPYGVPLLIGGLAVYYSAVQLTGRGPALAAIYWTFGKFGMAVAAAGLVLYALHSNPRFTVLHNPVTMHLGKISYGLYLYHNVLVFHYREISALVGLNPAAHIDYDPATNMLSDPAVPLLPKLLGVAVCLTLVIGVAELSYRIIERPALRLKNRFRSRPFPQPGSPEMTTPTCYSATGARRDVPRNRRR